MHEEVRPTASRRSGARRWTVFLFLCMSSAAAQIGASERPRQAAVVSGRVLDETGAVLPGATIDLHARSGTAVSVASDERGEFAFDGIAAGRYELVVRLLNFSTWRETISVTDGTRTAIPIVLHLALSADVVVTGRRSFRNLAEIENPKQNLVGVAASASEGAVTGRQLDTRPILRAGDVIESVPGVIVSQHSGEGKANQYYLRGFNLDHGTDFATTVAGVPVNLPTHAHGHGYSDVNFLIPELVSGIQFRKGPYYAEDDDFSAAGSANINYVNRLDAPIVRLSGGADGWRRLLAAGSPRVANGHLLMALEVNHNDGPWLRPDDYRKINAVIRYSRGTLQNGVTVTGMGYRGSWSSTDQVPARAVASESLDRFGTIDPSDRGETSRYSLNVDWQVTAGNTLTRASAFGLRYDLDLFSNFTYFLDDPEHGDQFEQFDSRFVSGGRLVHRRLSRWGRIGVEHLFGTELRRDDIGTVGLYQTQAGRRLGTVREDTVHQISGALFGQTAIDWGGRLRAVMGLRGDAYRFNVRNDVAERRNVEIAALASPKLTVIYRPSNSTELFVNAGSGFHSNDARGTLGIGPSGGPAAEVTPLVRARGAELGVRTIAIPHLQSTVAVWRRLAVDMDFSWSRGRFRDRDAAGDRIPGAIERVASLGVSVDPSERLFGSLRWRYFGPRALTEEARVRSRSTSLLNGEVGYRLSARYRLVLDGYNLLNARDSDIDYFYTSRLPGEPLEGIEDRHFHPAVPRTVRATLHIAF